MRAKLPCFARTSFDDTNRQLCLSLKRYDRLTVILPTKQQRGATGR